MRFMENSAAATQYSPAKFCLFRDRASPFHNNPPVTLQYSAATPIPNENPVGVYVLQGPQLYLLKVKDISECFANFGNFTGFCGHKLDSHRLFASYEDQLFRLATDIL